MIHKKLDALIMHFGGIAFFIKELKKKEIIITHSAVKKWYTSNQVNPPEVYREKIEEIAKEQNLEIQFEAEHE